MNYLDNLRMLWSNKKYREFERSYNLGKWQLKPEIREKIEDLINNIPIEDYAVDNYGWKIVDKNM